MCLHDYTQADCVFPVWGQGCLCANTKLIEDFGLYPECANTKALNKMPWLDTVLAHP